MEDKYQFKIKPVPFGRRPGYMIYYRYWVEEPTYSPIKYIAKWSSWYDTNDRLYEDLSDALGDVSRMKQLLEEKEILID